MNNYNLALQPDLHPVFAKSALAAVSRITNNRELFHALLQKNNQDGVLACAYNYLKHQLRTATESYLAEFSDKFTAGNLNYLLKNIHTAQAYELPEAAVTECLTQYAPIFFTELSWLAQVSQTATSQAPLALDLTAIYLRLTKSSHSIPKSRELYHADLQARGVNLPAIHTLAFAKNPNIGDEFFDLAATQLALAQFPRTFFPEILGFTLAHCQSLSLAEEIFSASPDVILPIFLTGRSQDKQKETANVLAIIKTYFSEFNKDADALWQRIQCGFWLYQDLQNLCEQRLNAQLHGVESPRQAMEKLLAKLVPNAIGHHGKIRLGGKTIDDWFKETPFKSANFLATLSHSPYVDRAKPENSHLLKLFEFNGPMFGVMDDSGKAIVKNWLMAEISLSSQSKKTKTTTYKVGLKSLSSAPARGSYDFSAPSDSSLISKENYNSLSSQELFYYLVNEELHPSVLPAAKRKVERVLRMAKLFCHLPLNPYTHKGFEDYIQKIYQRESKGYKPLGKKPKLSKEAYIWGIEQFAPTILTDGSWLQGIQQLDYFPNYAIGALLHKIYQDESGSGKLDQNHPRIYEELLANLNIKLPPIYAKEFCKYPGFLNGAFDIPVYLMAISKFPNSFLPELLGLNMAIEISGLGRVYLNLSEELKFWGIPSAIVDVHTSIDNLATGHSALAIKAIQTYLDDIAANFGDTMLQAHWRRIYTGFRSLTTVSWRFKFALLSHYFLKRPDTAPKPTIKPVPQQKA